MLEFTFVYVCVCACVCVCVFCIAHTFEPRLTSCIKLFCFALGPPPPPSTESGGTYAHFPSPELPYLGKKI